MSQQDASLSLLVKLGSIAVHTEEMLSGCSPMYESAIGRSNVEVDKKSYEFDVGAIKSLLQDAEVQEFMKNMAAKALLPVKR